MNGLMFLCHEAGNGETMEGIDLNMHAPYFYPTSTQVGRFNSYCIAGLPISEKESSTSIV
jgi:hypothetical protein